MIYIRILYKAPAKYMQAMHICPYEQTCMHAHTHGYIRMLPTHTHAPHIHTTCMHQTNTMHRPHIHITHTHLHILQACGTHTPIHTPMPYTHAIHTHSTHLYHTYTTHEHIAVGKILFSSSSLRRQGLSSSSAIVVVGHRRSSSSVGRPSSLSKTCGSETRYPYPYTPQYIRFPRSRP